MSFQLTAIKIRKNFKRKTKEIENTCENIQL